VVRKGGASLALLWGGADGDVCALECPLPPRPKAPTGWLRHLGMHRCGGAGVVRLVAAAGGAHAIAVLEDGAVHTLHP